MLQELMRVQKSVFNHEQVIHQVMSYLLSVDARQKRGSKSSVPFQAAGQSGSAISPPVADDEEPSTPLQNATKLLGDMNGDIQYNPGSLDSTLNDPQKAAASMAAANVAAVNMVPTPTMDNGPRSGSVRPPTSAGSNSTMMYPKVNPSELESVVYPVGGTNGIDPSMYSENINSVPYPMPPKELEPSDARRVFPNNRKKTSNVDPGWMRSPQILLVEDDATCRQIGGKFLYSFSCVIDTAVCIQSPSKLRLYDNLYD